ncbi:MAG TPA: hypothetical protein VNI77_10535 [Nitrososphaera sp.]|nr:hypothetical protein [Nitrososphaera sp.]
MQRYDVFQFDRDTFVVFDRQTNREICICGNYEGGMDAEKRAVEIAYALNAKESKKTLNNEVAVNENPTEPVRSTFGRSNPS